MIVGRVGLAVDAIPLSLTKPILAPNAGGRPVPIRSIHVAEKNCGPRACSQV